MTSPSTPAAVALAAAVRKHLEQSRDQVVDMPRAGAGVGQEDARQMVKATYLAILESIEGAGRERRDAFVEEAVRATKANGVAAETMITGVVRASIVLVTNVSHELTDDVREAAGQIVGEFVGHLVCDVVGVFAGKPEATNGR